MKKIVFLVIYILLWAARSQGQGTCGGSAENDKALLLEFQQVARSYATTETWNSTQPMSSWNGITLNAEGRVIKITTRIKAKMPESFGGLACLQELYLDANVSGDLLPLSLTQLSNLKKITLSAGSSAGYIFVSDLGQRMPAIEELILNIHFGGLPSSLGQISTLKKLTILCQTASFPYPEWTCNLANLEEMTLKILAENVYASLPTSICFPSNLNTLYVKGFNRLPDNIGDAVSLNSLTIFECNLATNGLPSSIGNLHALKTLSITYSSLTSLPSTIGNLALLENLTVHNNQLSAIPSTISGCVAVKYLSFSSNLITTLPESLSQCLQLISISAGGNKLTSLPTSFGNLRNLKELNLASNNFSVFPTVILSCLTLDNLNISYNKLTTLPSNIDVLSNLKTLYLNNNLLSVLPDAFCNLSVLQNTDLSNNKLTILPSCIGSLANLTNLKVYNNLLTTLPEGIGQLVKLSSLSVGKNKLTSLPLSMSQMTALKSSKSIGLSENSLTFEDLNVLGFRPITCLDDFNSPPPTNEYYMHSCSYINQTKVNFAIEPVKKRYIVGDKIKVTFNADASMSNNRYEWLIDGATTINSGINWIEFTINQTTSFSIYCKVTNNLFSELVLESETKTILASEEEVYYALKAGNWSDPTIWYFSSSNSVQNAANELPSPTATVYIHGFAVTVNNVHKCEKIILTKLGTLSSLTITSSGNLEVSKSIELITNSTGSDPKIIVQTGGKLKVIEPVISN
jgi:Leucine-rich repeat (LRR) protein